MDNQNPPTSPQQPGPQNPTSVVSPPSSTSPKVVIRPSSEFVAEMKATEKNNPTQALPTPAATPQVINTPPKKIDTSSIYPSVADQTSATIPQVQSTQPGDYNPSVNKVSDRATSLKLYSIVILILSGLSLLATLSILSSLRIYDSVVTAHNVTLALATDVRYATAFFPIAACIVFLISKSVTLVKALLIVMLINYAIGLLTFISILFSAHVSFSPILAVSFIIDIAFALWTWSVFSEVSLLQI
jgi:hypothetical protein